MLRVRCSAVGVCLLNLFAVGGCAEEERGHGTECVTGGFLEDESFELALEGVEPFGLSVRESAGARVTFRGDAPPLLEIRTPHLTVAAMGQLDHHLRRRYVTANGILTLGEGAPIGGLRSQHSSLHGTVELGDNIVIHGVEVSCDAVAPGDSTERWRAELETDAGEAIGFARSRGPTLTIHDQPQSQTKLSLHVKDSDGSTFDVLTIGGEWTRIAWRGSIAAIDGWVRSDAIETVESGDSRLSFALGCCGGRMLATEASRRTGTLRTGATMHAAPSGAKWAVVEAEVEVVIEYLPGADWLRVLRNPDLREKGCDPVHGWVRARDLSFSAAESSIPAGW